MLYVLLEMMNHIVIEKKQQHYIIKYVKKIINLAIREAYFIFSRWNIIFGIAQT